MISTARDAARHRGVVPEIAVGIIALALQVQWLVEPRSTRRRGVRGTAAERASFVPKNRVIYSAGV